MRTRNMTYVLKSCSDAGQQEISSHIDLHVDTSIDPLLAAALVSKVTHSRICDEDLQLQTQGSMLKSHAALSLPGRRESQQMLPLTRSRNGT